MDIFVDSIGGHVRPGHIQVRFGLGWWVRAGGTRVLGRVRVYLTPRTLKAHVSLSMFTKLRILDLCSGSQSLRKAADQYPGHFVYTSVDWDAKTNPTICTDLHDWQPPAPGSFDIIWFSPQCTAYSRLQHCHPHLRASRNGRMAEADKLVLRGLQLIQHLQPAWVFIENPYTGELRHRGIIPATYSMQKVSYCKYGYAYQKQTSIWTNLKGWTGQQCQRDCWAWSPHVGRHHGWVGQSHSYGRAPRDDKSVMSVPTRLLQELLEAVMIQQNKVRV